MGLEAVGIGLYIRPIVLIRNGDDGDVALVRLGPAGQALVGRAAGRAPGGPEFHDRHLALQGFAVARAVAPDDFQVEGGGGLADEPGL